MNGRRIRAGWLAVTTALVLVVVTSCALPARPASPPTPTTPAAPVKSFPPRPREVHLDGIDPCTLITPELRKQLYGLDDHFTHDKIYDQLTSSNCFLITDQVPTYGFVIRLVTSQGADHFLSSPKTQLISVDGYGALDQPGLNEPTGNKGCLVTVDVAPGQSLRVSFEQLNGPPPGYQKMCTKVNAAAESVMQQLLARAS